LLASCPAPKLGDHPLSFVCCCFVDMRFGTWNIKCLYWAGSLVTISKELSKYRLDLVGLQQVRQEGGGGTQPKGK
jgi:hypothetical protein